LSHLVHLMGRKRRKTHYAVALGRRRGIYLSWDQCKAQTNGFPGAIYKGFCNVSEAQAFLDANLPRATRPASSAEPTLPHSGVSSFSSSTVAAFRPASSSVDGRNDLGCVYGFAPSGTGPASPSLSSSDGTAANDRNLKRKRGGAADVEASRTSAENLGRYSSFSLKVMKKQGFVEGMGLGSRGQGITSTIKLAGQHSREGIGSQAQAEAGIALSKEQQAAVDSVMAGHNVFITGQAGTGKSVVLRRLTQLLRQQHPGKGEFVLTASTGVSAIAIGGSTLHRFAGIGLAKTTNDFRRAWSRKKEWRRACVLVIDEISMLHGSMFDALDREVRAIRGNKDKAFGGIQLVFCGDFAQLPPVQKRGVQVGIMYTPHGFAFESALWRDANFVTCTLRAPFRQQGDNNFIAALGDVRSGNGHTARVNWLVDTCSESAAAPAFASAIDGGIEATLLYTHNVDVDSKNTERLRKLPGKERVFLASDSAVTENGEVMDVGEVATLFRDFQAPSTLELKVGAQVMLLQRLEEGTNLVNGSRGVVVGFEADDFPIVQFMPSAKTGAQRIRVGRGKFESEIVGRATIRRTQVPLRLAWACTVHKSQGLSLDKVTVDLSRCFATGQAYTALSRARTTAGLKIRGLRPSCVRLDPKVARFYGFQPCGAAAAPVSAASSYPEEQKQPPSSKLAEPRGHPQALANKRFVITGLHASFDRATLTDIIARHGGKVTTAVSGKTDYLLAGEFLEDGRQSSEGKKYKMAKAKHIPIIGEDALCTLIRLRSTTPLDSTVTL